MNFFSVPPESLETFRFYFPMGWEHIISLNALDHLAFLAALGASFLFPDWRRVLVVVTAFTVGHSLTLALSVYKILLVNESWVEWLIPITIILTAAQQWNKSGSSSKSVWLLYLSAIFFGFIHGMGFANNIRFMLVEEQSLGWGLMGFNLGLEAGQLIFIILFLLLSQAAVQFLSIKKENWTRSVVVITFGIALYILFKGAGLF